MTAPTITARPDGPAARLRAATTPIHRATEAEPFVVSLLAGERSVDDYRSLLAQLHPVYVALEEATAATRGNAPAVVAGLFDERLDRAPAIARDLERLASGAATPAPLAETEGYASRLAMITGDWARLLAHHYVRYLGDLSGGQIVAEMLRRHYGLTAEALTFYAFDGLGSKGAFKTRYREGMDTVLADPATYEVVLDETVRAYEANRALFAALERARS